MHGRERRSLCLIYVRNDCREESSYGARRRDLYGNRNTRQSPFSRAAPVRVRGGRFVVYGKACECGEPQKRSSEVMWVLATFLKF